MSWKTEDITFCANRRCDDISCRRNPKNIKLPIPHAFSCFMQCEKWNDDGGKWLMDRIKESEN